MKITGLVVLVSSVTFADCQLGDAVTKVRPGAAWNLRGDSYEGIEWLDSAQTKPTKNEIQAALDQCTTDAAARLSTRTAAKAILTDKTKTATQRLQALIDYLEIK